MTRVMYDGVTPEHLPTDGQIYAGYMNGRYSNMARLKAAHPGKIYVTISVDPGQVAQVYDCEPGNGKPSDAVDWVKRARAAGVDPTVYCGRNTWWTQIRLAFQWAGVPEPHYWVADGTISAVPVGAVALQYRLDVSPGYDKSVVLDYWPTIDGPAPAGTGTPITTPLKDDMSAAAEAQIASIFNYLFTADTAGNTGQHKIDNIYAAIFTGGSSMPDGGRSVGASLQNLTNALLVGGPSMPDGGKPLAQSVAEIHAKVGQ